MAPLLKPIRIPDDSATAEAIARGKRLRARVPRESHAEPVSADRDPVAVLERQNESRIPELVPVRIARMRQSIFAYYRGTAATMAQDLASGPTTGISVICCGDAHIGNFGLYASPERNLLFDLDDFDEAAVGPWEWDVKRLAASVVVGGRHNGYPEKKIRKVTRAVVERYRTALGRMVRTSVLDRHYLAVDESMLLDSSENWESVIRHVTGKARRRTSERVAKKIVTLGDDNDPRIVEDPPILVRRPAARDNAAEVFARYLATTAPDVQLLLTQFRIVDVALRVVGVGSVGTNCLIALLVGPSGELLFLQIKEAAKSVFETHGGISADVVGAGWRLLGQGHRVVLGQRTLQAQSDPFLGWVTGADGRDYYVRQFRDMKGSLDLDGIPLEEFADYSALCAVLLARAHAQSRGAPAVSGYLGRSEEFDEAVTQWCVAYADVVERDFAALGDAVASGRLPCAASDA